MDTLDEAATSEYYRAVAPTLQRYAELGTVRVASWQGGRLRRPGDGPVEQELVGGGRWIAWTEDEALDDPQHGTDPGRASAVPGCVRVSAGTGTDVAVAATAVLALVEALEDPGSVLVPASESTDTLLLYVRPREAVAAVVTTLVAQAPEIATEDPEAADGRALVQAVPVDAPLPLPYSLVDGADGTTAVVPLTVDEVAAVTAGMPLDPQPADVLDRLAVFGDLAAELLDGSTR